MDTRLKPYWLMAGIAQILAGISMLVFSVFLIGNQEIPIPRAVFAAHVPILLSLLLVTGGIGLLVQKSWGWISSQTVAFLVLIASIQAIVTVAAQGAMAFDLESLLLPALGFQTLELAILVLLVLKDSRERFKIGLADILTAALFATIIALDMNMTLYSLASN